MAAWEAYLDGSMDRYGGQWWYTDCPDAKVIDGPRRPAQGKPSLTAPGAGQRAGAGSQVAQLRIDGS